LNYNWIYPKGIPDQSILLATQLKVSPILAQILFNRGIKDYSSAQSFFNHSLKELHNPFLMKDMEKAVDKIIVIVKDIVRSNKYPNEILSDEHSEKPLIDAGSLITVYGDYDVDGTTGTALIVTFFRDIGIKISYYIPGRKSEGYGLNLDAVRQIASSGSRLIITVDCGISAYDEIVEAKKLGVDVVITDHHQVPAAVPPAFAILNPNQDKCPYPYKDLCGAGVAFKLITALRTKLRGNDYFKNKLPNLKRHLDFVALGTIADMAPITGENRHFVDYGLKELTLTNKPGLEALKKIAGCQNKNISVSDVGFLLGPRLNAAGRLETAENVVKLLLSEDADVAEKIATYLNQTNLDRRKIQAEIFREAEELIKNNPGLRESYTIVLVSENWHQGVIGVVASKLMNKYYKPIILIAIEGSMGKASGRSIEGFNLYKNITKCSDLLVKYGGHAMAAGFSIEKTAIDNFIKFFEEESHKSITDPKIFNAPLKIDALVPLDGISHKFYNELEMLEPCGIGNPKPVLMAKNVSLPISPTLVGKKGEHIKFKVKDGKNVKEVIGFNKGNLISKFDFVKDRFDIAFSVSLNKWNNTEKIQLNLKDFRLTLG